MRPIQEESDQGRAFCCVRRPSRGFIAALPTVTERYRQKIGGTAHLSCTGWGLMSAQLRGQSSFLYILPQRWSCRPVPPAPLQVTSCVCFYLYAGVPPPHPHLRGPVLFSGTRGLVETSRALSIPVLREKATSTNQLLLVSGR